MAQVAQDITSATVQVAQDITSAAAQVAQDMLQVLTIISAATVQKLQKVRRSTRKPSATLEIIIKRFTTGIHHHHKSSRIQDQL